ncbi:MAG: PEP-CTERM sorting domain-containing protein [Phycisphaeraceae bacterium]|nr:PEP-CTERM sorting domain-containing protein [Phycisphaeraceae bacterium]
MHMLKRLLLCLLLGHSASGAIAGTIVYDANPGPAPDPSDASYDAFPSEQWALPWIKWETLSVGSSVIYGSMPAWAVSDGIDNAWYASPTQADNSTGAAHGWTLSATVSMGGLIANQPSIFRVEYDDQAHGTAWALGFRNAGGGLMAVHVNINGGTHYLPFDTAFHEYQLVYSPGAGGSLGNVDLFVDGSLQLADIGGYSAIMGNQVWFGDSSSSASGGGTLYVNRLSFTTHDPTYHPGDANGDGMVNLADLQILGDNWQSSTATWAEADFTGDGVVNLADLQIVGDNWGYGATPDIAFDDAHSLTTVLVPEPGTLILLAGGLLGLCLRNARAQSHATSVQLKRLERISHSGKRSSPYRQQ